jgi:hypothetical protein
MKKKHLIFIFTGTYQMGKAIQELKHYRFPSLFSGKGNVP